MAGDDKMDCFYFSLHLTQAVRTMLDSSLSSAAPVCMRDEYLCHQMGLAGIPLHCGETKHFLITFLCQCNNTIVGIIAGRPGRWQIISPLSTLPTIHWQNIFRFLICRPWRNMNLPAAGDQAANQNKKLIVPVNWWLSGKILMKSRQFWPCAPPINRKCVMGDWPRFLKSKQNFVQSNDTLAGFKWYLLNKVNI